MKAKSSRLQRRSRSNDELVDFNASEYNVSMDAGKQQKALIVVEVIETQDVADTLEGGHVSTLMRLI